MLQEAEAGLELLLINAVGILGSWAEVADSDPERWWQTFDVNLKALYASCRAVLPYMTKAKSGTIINFSSMGCYLCNPGGSAYYCSKAAVSRCANAAPVGILGGAKHVCNVHSSY